MLTVDETTKKLKELLKTTHPMQIASKLRLGKAYRNIYESLIKHTSFLDSYNPTITERIYCLLNEIYSRPKCETCGKTVKFHSLTEGYPKYCSNRCVGKSKNRIKKQQKTCLKKYGDISPLSKKSSCYNRVKEGVIKKYGVDNVQKVKEIQEKRKQTCQERYGVSHPMQCHNISTKYASTLKVSLLKKYGVDNVAKLPHIQTKISKTHKSEKTKVKIRQTLKKKYGLDVCNVSQIPAVKKKIRITMAEKYGGWKNQEHIKNFEKYNDSSFWNKEFVLSNRTLDVAGACQFFGVSDQTIKHHATEILRLNINLPRNSSKIKQEIALFVKQLLGKQEVFCNTRKVIPPFEIDVYVPSKHLAIELDGVYWHSIGKYPWNNLANEYYEKNRLVRKFEKIKEKGLNLLNFRDIEWIHKQQICKSMIKSKLSLIDRKISARKCELVELSTDKTNSFLNQNHLQGSVPGGKIRLSLMSNNEIVCVATFGKWRFGKNSWELLRFSNKIDTVVVGGISKIIKHFLKSYKTNKLISYANKRWSNGNVYRKIGFEFIRDTGLGYCYVHPSTKQLISRQTFQKHKLYSLLGDKFDKNKTEKQNMINAGYRVLYEPGNLLFQIK